MEGRRMQRDMDLIRAILLKLEGDVGPNPAAYSFDIINQRLVIDGYSNEAVFGHLLILLKSPFITGKLLGTNYVGISSITWEGHDFIDSIRDSKIWHDTKEGAKEAGGFTIELLSSLAKGLIKKKIEEHTGVKLDL
jgi:hypothetical protein